MQVAHLMLKHVTERLKLASNTQTRMTEGLGRSLKLPRPESPVIVDGLARCGGAAHLLWA